MHKSDDCDCLNSVMTAAEAAAIWNLTRNAISDACRRGALPARQSGRTWLITVGDMLAYKHGHYWPSLIPVELQPALDRALDRLSGTD